MTFLPDLLAQILHLGLMLAIAPIAAGLAEWLDARLAGRSGPPVMLPWRNLIRLARKTRVDLENASPVLRFGPGVTLGATIAAAALVPSFALGMTLSPLADGVVIVSLLALGRVAAGLTALDAGTAAEGLAVQRDSALSALAEPARMLCVIAAGLIGGSFNLDGLAMLQHDGITGPGAASALAVAALLALLPLDHAIPNRMLAGRDAATLEFAGALRRLVWLSLTAVLFFPAGIAAIGAGPAARATGLVCWSAKIAILIAGLALARTLLGTLADRPRQDAAAIAVALALLAIVVALTGAGAA